MNHQHLPFSDVLRCFHTCTATLNSSRPHSRRRVTKMKMFESTGTGHKTDFTLPAPSYKVLSPDSWQTSGCFDDISIISIMQQVQDKKNPRVNKNLHKDANRHVWPERLQGLETSVGKCRLTASTPHPPSPTALMGVLSEFQSTFMSRWFTTRKPLTPAMSCSDSNLNQARMSE